METLKRCPSCGGEAELMEYKPYTGKKLFRVACRKCGLGTGERITAELAADSWNTRYASKFALPVGCDGREIDLGELVTHASTGAVGKVLSITFAAPGFVTVRVRTKCSTFEAVPAGLMSGEWKASDMASLEEEMQLSAAAYCSEVLDCEEADDMMPLVAVEKKLRDVKRRLEEIGGM